jgi:hypothetical protein
MGGLWHCFSHFIGFPPFYRILSLHFRHLRTVVIPVSEPLLPVESIISLPLGPWRLRYPHLLCVSCITLLNMEIGYHPLRNIFQPDLMISLYICFHGFGFDSSSKRPRDRSTKLGTDTCNAYASCTLYGGTRCDRSVSSCVFLTIVAAWIILNNHFWIFQGEIYSLVR